jgi:hypothetical protein
MIIHLYTISKQGLCRHTQHWDTTAIMKTLLARSGDRKESSQIWNDVKVTRQKWTPQIVANAEETEAVVVQSIRKPLLKRPQGWGGGGATSEPTTNCGIPEASVKQTKNSVIQGTLGGWMFRKKCWTQMECNSCIRDQGLKWQLWMSSKGHIHESLSHISGAEVKLAASSFIWIQIMNVKTLSRGQPLPKWKVSERCSSTDHSRTEMAAHS